MIHLKENGIFLIEGGGGMKEKDGDYAIYNGKVYKAFFDYKNDKLVLVSHDSSDLKKGFVQSYQDRYVKPIELNQVDTAYSITTKAIYKGREVGVTRETPNGEFVIFHGENDYCEKNGFEFLEPGVWEKVVTANELDKFWHKKTPIWGF
jgi:hypothetical protein